MRSLRPFGVVPRFGTLALLASFGAAARTSWSQGPTIDVWYGSNQSFGEEGHPQRFVNILGNASDADGVTSLTARLNGGPARALSIGPDERRLQSLGDFNVDIPRSTLVDGRNELELCAVDELGNATTESVSISYRATSSWPSTWSTHWSSLGGVEEGAQIGDGLWYVDPAGDARTTSGYDRTLMIGEEGTWQNFEVLVPITLHGFDPAGFQGTALAPAFGITNRWRGHTERIYQEQPFSGWTQQGGGSWYEYSASGGARLSLMGFDGMRIDRPMVIPIGQKHWWKLRSESLPNGHTFYGFKLWPDGAPEPLFWTMNGTEGPDDLQRGSLLFIVHYVDVSIGDVQVTALEDEFEPPTLLDLEWEASSTRLRATWRSDEPTSFELAYGLTPALELGSVRGTDPLVRHSAVIGGLRPNREYYVELRGTDARGQSATPLHGMLTTAGAAPPRARGVVSDDFSGPSLNAAIWTFIDPKNDAHASLNGHQLAIEVPAGQSHGGWYDTAGNQMPRVVQQIGNVDFEIEAKFDVPPTGTWTAQGIVVEQDANNFLRFDFLVSNLGTCIWVGGARNGNLPLRFEGRLLPLPSPAWIKVWREGSRWTVWYSFDGSVWNHAVVFDHALPVERVGVAAGNVEGNAHTTAVDYFFVTLHPVEPEDGMRSTFAGGTLVPGTLGQSP